MTKQSFLGTALAGLLLAAGASAGEKAMVQTYTTSGDDGQVRIVLSGEGEGNVLVVSGSGEGGAKSLRMQSRDGRMVVESEPDPDRPWLGVLLTTTDEGSEITSVMDGSPAAEAGLKAGDFIVRADDRDLSVEGNRGNLLEGKRPGDRVRFRVLRDGREETVRVKLGSHPGRVEFEVGEDLGPFGIAGSALEGLESLKKLESLKGLSMLPLFDCDDDEEPCLPTILSFARSAKPRLGVVLESLSPQLAGFFQVEEGQGLLVKEVSKGSVAETAGVQAGDVLVRIDDVDIASVADVRRALKDVGKGETVLVEVVRRGLRQSFTAEMDTEPNEGSSAAFRSWPDLNLKLHDTQGALRWLEENRALVEQEAAAELREALREAREASVTSSEAAAEALRLRDESGRRALEEALAAARSSGTTSEAHRTF